MVSTLSLLGVSKNYGGAQALVSVDLSLVAGTVHALVGENGAGKSTATRILAGLEQPSAGTVAIDGTPVQLSGRPAAIRHGIGLVPQQVSLVPEFTLVENFLLTQPEQLARRSRAKAVLADAASRAGLDVDLAAPVRQLGIAERQLGELAIALAQGAETLLLDEPTSTLGPFETAGLFARLRVLADSGARILLITHRLDEVRLVADRVTVLSHGRVSLDAAVADVGDDDLVRALLTDRGERASADRGERTAGTRARLVISNASARNTDSVGAYDIDLTVAEGEIVGVLGVAGNGQRALADLAAGVLAPRAGSVMVDGVDVTGAPARALRAGVAYVPESRLEAVIPDAPATWTAVATRVDRFVGTGSARLRGIRWRDVADFTRGLFDRHDVRPRSIQLSAGAFSGGNQQKLLVGRELDGTPAVVVLHAPTQGLDINASAAIRGEILTAASRGAAVLLVSADIDEVRELADRVVVLARGRVADEFPIADFDTERVGRAMSGLTEGAAS
ncbi:ABC transporter ATP-binding protein [Schumannella luteola]